MSHAEVAKIIFVAGISFSGSTLMGLMLGAQPNAVFGGELKDYKRRLQSQTPWQRILLQLRQVPRDLPVLERRAAALWFRGGIEPCAGLFLAEPDCLVLKYLLEST